MWSWQQHNRCHFAPFVINISGAKFEKHCFNISRDIVYSVFYNFSCKPYDVITFPICIIENVNISKMKKDIPERKMSFLLFFKSLSAKLQLVFISWAL